MVDISEKVSVYHFSSITAIEGGCSSMNVPNGQGNRVIGVCFLIIFGGCVACALFFGIKDNISAFNVFGTLFGVIGAFFSFLQVFPDVAQHLPAIFRLLGGRLLNGFLVVLL